MECTNKKPEIANYQLRPHQGKVINYLLKSKHRGMIFYHGLGAGKTISSLSFATEFIDKNPKGKIYIITPGSLRINFMREYCKFIAKKKYMKHFVFLSYNYTKLNEKLKKLNFDNSVIIVDEFHNLINGARNLSHNYVALYQKIYKSVKSKVLLLSGTPLVYYPYEISLIYNLVKKDSFPLDTQKFEKMCKIGANGRLIISDREDFKERMTGVLSYIKNLGEQYYPKVVHMPDTYVTITNYQLPYYVRQRLKEIQIGLQVESKKSTGKFNIMSENIGQRKVNPAQFLALAMMMSTQVANFTYPKKYQDMLLGDDSRKEKSPDRSQSKNRSKSRSKERSVKRSKAQEIIDYRQHVADILSGKVKTNVHVPSDEDIEINLSELKTKYSPKFHILLERVKKLKGKHLIYTQFLSRHGVKLLVNLLNKVGITTLTYTGDTLSDVIRDKILTDFNGEDNIHGQKYKVMLTTSAGTQGLTLTEVNHVHIMEPHRSEIFVDQLIGRAVRYQSHERIKKIRNYVHVYRYYCRLPKRRLLKYGDKVLKEKKSSDEMIYENAIKKQKYVAPLLKMMKETSIDCDENYGKNCYI